MTHKIIIRYNQGLYGSTPFNQVDWPYGSPQFKVEQWWKHRKALFERFTLPSLIGQSCQDFEVYLLIDPDTPNHHMKDLISFHTRMPQLKLSTKKVFGKFITRIDNDDAIHQDYVKDLHDSVDKFGVYIYPNGHQFVVSENQGYFYHYTLNNNPTIYTNRDRDIYAYHHDRISSNFNPYYLTKEPRWMIVVHDLNIANRRIGKNKDWKSVDYDNPITNFKEFNINV